MKTQIVVGVPVAPPKRRINGAIIQFTVLFGTAAWIYAGGPLHIVSLLLSATSLSIVLLVLDAEKRRSAALHATLDRLSREIGVRASGQD